MKIWLTAFKSIKPVHSSICFLNLKLSDYSVQLFTYLEPAKKSRLYRNEQSKEIKTINYIEFKKKNTNSSAIKKINT